ncbi:MAG: ABC transporter permease [Peptostreptococcaceae bacterium]
MNLYTSLTIKYLKENKRRTIITIIGVILSTALICGIGNIFESLMDYQIRATSENKGSFHVSFNGIETKNLKYINENAEVEKVGLSNILGSAEIDNENRKLLTIKEYDNNGFDGYKIKLIEGRLPTNKNEIVLSEDSLNSFEKTVKVGDSINLQIGKRLLETGQEMTGASLEKGEYIDNPISKNYKVVGVVKKPGFEVGKAVTYGFSYLETSTKNDFETINANVIMKNPKDVYKNAPKIAEFAELENVESHSDNDYGIYYNNHLLNLIGGSKYEHIGSTIKSAILLATSLVMICTIFTVYNTFSISIVERKKQFGVLSSIGSTKNQIIKMVLTEGLIVSLIGVPIGLLCGTVAIDILFKSIAKLFENTSIAELGLRVIYSPKVILLSALLVLATIFIAVMIPAIKAAKISPLEAIRNTGDFKFKKVKSSKLVKLIFKTEGVLAYKNIKRNRRRYRSIVISMIVSIVIFVSFSGFMKMMLKGQEVMNSKLNYNIQLSSISSDEDNNINKVKEEVKKLEGVNNFSEYDFGQQTYFSMNLKESDFNNKLNKEEKEMFKKQFTQEEEGENVVYKMYNNMLNFPGEEYIEKINLKDGNFDKEKAIKENGVILVNKSSYSAPGKRGEVTITNHKVGDIVNISLEDGVGEKIGDAKFKIMGITDERIVGFSTYREGGLDFITYDEVGKKVGANVSKGTLFIDVDNNKSIEQIQNIANKYQYNFYDEIEAAEDMKQTYKVMQIFVYGFLVVISLVSATNIVNTISTNINLRKRELAIIKSIGVTPQGFNRMVYLESILYGTISLVYALPIAIVMCVAMHNRVSDVISFGIIIPWEAILVSIFAVYLITVVSAMIPMKRLNKENIIESIRQESI